MKMMKTSTSKCLGKQKVEDQQGSGNAASIWAI